jgi:tryptophan synthase alpha chain
MSQIAKRFSKGKLLIPYLVSGFPDLNTSKELMVSLVKCGCSIIEIGVPYSDPLADGPTIQHASEAALKNKINTDQVFDQIRQACQQVDFSPVVMIYYNLIYRYGLEKFVKRAANSGVEGVIVPDLSVEEAGKWRELCQNYQVDTIFLVAPTSPAKRIEKITAASQGFVYCVSLTGVTGARQKLPDNLVSFVEQVKGKAKTPVAVGFGVSNPRQARQIGKIADGVIIGSAIIDIIAKAENGQKAVDLVCQFASSVLQAI